MADKILLPEERSLKVLQASVVDFPETLVILGSGWNRVLDNAKIETQIGYDQLFGAKTSVPGHLGRLIIAKIKNKRIAFMAGRFHMYEGYNGYEVTKPIRVFAQAGLKNLILTAASGALNENYRVGDFVILSDLISLFLTLDNPLVGPQFIDVSQVFDKDLRKKAIEIANKLKLPIQEGIYVYNHGPSFETPADKRTLKILGADVVGMSVVPETLVARSLNIKVLGLAFVTNLAFVKHDHLEVLAEAEKSGEKMQKFLTNLLT